MLRARSTKEATALRTTVQITHLLQAVISIDNTAKQTWNHIRVMEWTAVWEIEWYLGKQKIRRWFFLYRTSGNYFYLASHVSFKKKKKATFQYRGNSSKSLQWRWKQVQKKNKVEKTERKETYLWKNTLRSPTEYRTDGKPWWENNKTERRQGNEKYEQWEEPCPDTSLTPCHTATVSYCTLLSLFCS